MSNQVYFNEPYHEYEQKTEVGRKKNNAYENIVKYANLKYAIIDMINKPPKGFESVILKHFWLKKEEIIKQAEAWVKEADNKDVDYTGLVKDHN